jgi:hypothetical protein
MNGVPGVKVVGFFDTLVPLPQWFLSTMVAREISFLAGFESRFESTLAIDILFQLREHIVLKA